MKRRRKKDKVKNPYGNSDDVVFRNFDDPIVSLYRRKNSTMTEQQFAAACKYRDDYLTVGGQYGLAIDYTRERVDVFGYRGTFSERQAEAAKRLGEANALLDKDQYSVVVCVLGEHETLSKIAYRWNGSSAAHHQRTVKDTLMEGLDILAEHYGYAGKARPSRRRPHRWRDQEQREYPEQSWGAYVYQQRRRK